MHPDPRTPARRASSALRRVRRSLLARRRSLAAVCAALAVLVSVQAARGPATTTVPVLVAAHDLAGGRQVAPGDLVRREYAEGSRPSGAVTDPGSVVGRVLAAPVREGEPLTDVRLVGPGLLDGYPGLVVTPVRVADADAVRLVTVGDRIDLVASDPETGQTDQVAVRAPVVAVPRSRPDRATGFELGALVVVAVSPEESLALARASGTAVVSVAFSR